jgi:hypothetical protein
LKIDENESSWEFDLIAVVEGTSGTPLRQVKGSTKYFKLRMSRKQASKKGKEKELVTGSDEVEVEVEDVDSHDGM